MLRLIIGKAGTGKTAAVNQEIRSAVLEKKGGRFLVVPEQYSHEAERELCRVCGDTLSLYAEVLSFTGLARKCASVLGGIAVPYLDEGGRMLCMAQAMKSVGSRLEVFRNAAGKPELQSMLLTAIDTMKASCVTAQMLLDASLECGGDLGKKLTDLAVISEGYTAVLGQSHADPSDALSSLAAGIDAGFLTDEHVIYVDGFSDFTVAELSVLRAILACGASLTVCLTLDQLKGRNEVFSLPRFSAQKLLSFADQLHVESTVTCIDEEDDRKDPIRIFTDHLFSYTENTYSADGKIELFRAESMRRECEAAAAKAIALVRDHSYRWRDIAIAVRGFENYAAILENTFAEYGVPLFTSRRNEIASRPLSVAIFCAYDIIQNGWKADDLLRYLGTGLVPLSPDEAEMLAEYIFLWNLGERDWKSREPWRQNPGGYRGKDDEETEETLRIINAFRTRIASPLLAFQQAERRAVNAFGHIEALSAFLRDARIPELLEEKARRLRETGRRGEAEETAQLWEILVNALDQAYAILGETEMDTDAFSRLFQIMLSRYDVGIIPASLDAVTAGDFDRMRRRAIKALFVLGADDARLPAAESTQGIFSDDELLRLSRTSAAFGEEPDNELWREYLRLYNCLSLPSENLALFYPTMDEGGNETRPSLVMRTAERLFTLPILQLSPEQSALASPRSAFRFALSAEGPSGTAAAEYFDALYPGALASVRENAAQMREALSPKSAETLYGRQMRISASRAEKFFACRFSFFCEYGLRIRPFRRAVFSAPELGSFTHYVLQHTAEEVMQHGGFQAVNDASVEEYARQAVSRYIQKDLNDFAEKSERFIYLFRRSAEDVVRVASDMARELRRTEFVPLAFELNFGEGGHSLSLSLNEGQDRFAVTGIADRIDGWEHDGKVYLRVFDYKTGNKKFSFQEVWYGLSMQLLLYLYALREQPETTRQLLHLSPKTDIALAGAVYVPAAERFLSVDADAGDEEIASERRREQRRSGIVLNENDLPQAWETGQENIYSPFRTGKDGEPSGDALMTEAQFELLYSHMKKLLGEMALAVRSGSVEANPYRKGSETPCDWCSVRESCGFADGENGEKCRVLQDIRAKDALDLAEKEGTDHGEV